MRPPVEEEGSQEREGGEDSRGEGEFLGGTGRGKRTLGEARADGEGDSIDVGEGEIEGEIEGKIEGEKAVGEGAADGVICSWQPWPLVVQVQLRQSRRRESHSSP